MTRMILEFLEFGLYWIIGGQIVLLLGITLFAYFLSRSKYKKEYKKVLDNKEYLNYYYYYELAGNKIKSRINQFVFWPIHLFLYCKYTWDIVTKGSI